MEDYINSILENDITLGQIIKSSVEQYAIQEFDQEIKSRLRRVYYGCLSGLIYFLGETDYYKSHGNKMEMLAYILDDMDYEIVHGKTSTSIREGHDITTWIEVKTCDDIWVYDVDKMIKMKKRLFDRLEKPQRERIIPKEVLQSHPGYDREDFSFNKIPFVIVAFLKKYESDTSNPHYSELQAEIKRFKKDINYDRVVREYHRENDIITMRYV